MALARQRERERHIQRCIDRLLGRPVFDIQLTMGRQYRRKQAKIRRRKQRQRIKVQRAIDRLRGYQTWTVEVAGITHRVKIPLSWTPFTHPDGNCQWAYE